MSEEQYSQELSDQVFDYFLHEMLSQQSPPDFTSRIAEAWSRENALHLGGPASGTAHPVIPLAVEPLAVATVIAKPIRAPQGTPPTRRQQKNQELATGTRLPSAQNLTRRRNALAALLALGACGLLAWLGARLANQDRLDLARMINQSAVVGEASGESSPEPSPAIAPHASGQPAETIVESRNVDSDAGSSSPIPMNLADVPFRLDRTANTTDAGGATAGDPSSIAQGGKSTPAWMDGIAGQSAMEGQQIVGYIDEQLALAWQGVEIQPAQKLSRSELNQRISRILTDEPAPENVSSDLDTLVSQATASLPFARRWAHQFVELWFAGDISNVDAASVQSLKQHFASQIYTDYPWNLAVADLLGADQPALVEDSTAETFVSALAGNGNHRLITRLGTSFLDVNLSCIRCHDANLSQVDLARASDSLEPSGPRSSGSSSGSPSIGDSDPFALQQGVYWSLAALLHGIDVDRKKDGQLNVVDRQLTQLTSGQAPTTYYELLDGRLQIAHPQLPDGQSWKALATARVPRQALGSWLSQSPAVDATTVNQVWEMVFGAPLVDPASDIDTADTQSRRALQLFLAGQYRAHHHDLKQLVGWIVRSDAFSRQRIERTRSQWLDASPEELRAWTLAEANFASGPQTKVGATSVSLESTLVASLSAIERSAVSDQAPTLAQPNPELPAGKTPVEKRPDSQPVAESFQLAELPADELQLVDRLLRSPRLSWKERVEHVVWLDPQSVPDSRIIHLADELLRLRSGDASAALRDLLAAVRRNRID